jgi:hypothetical protein
MTCLRPERKFATKKHSKITWDQLQSFSGSLINSCVKNLKIALLLFEQKIVEARTGLEVFKYSPFARGRWMEKKQIHVKVPLAQDVLSVLSYRSEICKHGLLLLEYDSLMRKEGGWI